MNELLTSLPSLKCLVRKKERMSNWLSLNFSLFFLKSLYFVFLHGAIR